MFLSQPTVSRHLHDFEAALKLTLFTRDKGRLVPNEAADSLYESSRFLEEGLSRLESRVASIRQGAGMRLSVMAVTSMTPYFVPQTVSRLVQDMPALDVSIYTGTFAHQLAELRNGQVDLGIATGQVSAQDIKVEKVGDGKLVALVPQDWELAGKPHIDLADLIDRPTVNLTARGPIGRVLSDALAERGLSFDRQITGHSLFTAPYLAATLDRAVVVDDFTAFNHRFPGLVPRPLTQDLRFDISAIFHGQSDRSIAAEHFVGHLRGLLKTWNGGPRPEI